MSRYAPRTRRGAHRTRRDLVAAVVPSLLAVAAVLSLVTALFVWRGQDLDPQDASAAAAPPGTATSRSAAPVAPDRTSSARATRPANTPSPTTSTTPPWTTASVTPASRIEVVVLNQTSRTGLAAAVADVLRGEGWDVAGVGNFRGIVPATTVYYPRGFRAEARAAAADLPTRPRTKPRFSNLSTSQLTVVVTDSYPT